MLQNIRERATGWFAYVIIILISIPFALWGINSYFDPSVPTDAAEVNGEPVPDEFMQGLRQENLAKDVYKDPDNQKFLSKFEDISIQDNKFVLRIKRDQDSGDVKENPMMEMESLAV